MRSTIEWMESTGSAAKLKLAGVVRRDALFDRDAWSIVGVASISVDEAGLDEGDA